MELPDGRVQIVTYHADHESGFVADVRYEGEAIPYVAPVHHAAPLVHGPVHHAVHHAPVHHAAPLVHAPVHHAVHHAQPVFHGAPVHAVHG